MRLFVAINLEPAERERITAALEPLRRHDWPVRWVAADALHLTLQFLGAVRAERVEGIIGALRDAAALHEPLELRLGGVRAFPTPRRPRVLWIGVESEPRLLALQRDVARSLASVGCEPERRAFAPHITVARVRREGRAPSGVAEALASIGYAARVDAHSIDLMKSTTGPGGATYERVAAVEL